MDNSRVEPTESARPGVPPIWFRLSPQLQLGLGLALASLAGAALGAGLGVWMSQGLAALATAALGGVVALVASGVAALVATRSAREALAQAMPAMPDEPKLGAFAPLANGAEVPGGVALHPADLASRLPASMPSSFESPSDIRDSLTGAFTQRYFIAAADREWSRIRRHGEDAALLMIDADRLRAVNETHGQECGDAVLVHLTRLVNATLRQYDLMARFNAGVLVVYLPHTDPIGAIDVAERIRERIANFRMNWPSGPVNVTVSVGVASIGADHTALDTVIGDAGAALRMAKADGRNCVRAAPVPPKRSPASGATLGDGRGAGPR